MKNLKIVLTCIAKGHSTILQDEKGDYFDNQSMNENCEERNIVGRLQYELYGEYPLSGENIEDWKLIKKAFNI